MPWWRVLFGIGAHVWYGMLLNTFPVINLMGVEFVGACGECERSERRLFSR
jgi:hypothetical protein